MQVEVTPTAEVAHSSGIEIRFFEEDKDAKVKRHYEARKWVPRDELAFPRLYETLEGPLSEKDGVEGLYTDWRELVSVTTAQKILHKEALISWAQRIGARGVVEMFNQGIVYPGEYKGQRVMATTDPKLGHILVGEQEALDLLKRYHLDTNHYKKAGGTRGQNVHTALEAWSTTGMIPNPATYPITEQGYVQGLVNFLTESEAISVRKEVLVASLEDEYAGRLDNDIELPKSVELMTHHTPAGRGNQHTWFEAGLYRVDLKTSKDAFVENGEQLEAYEKAAIECGLPSTIQRCIIVVSDEGRYKFVPAGSGEPTIKQFAWSTYEDWKLTLMKYKAMKAREARRKNA